MPERIAAASAVCESHIKQSVIRVTVLRQRIKGQMTGVVIGEGLFQADYLARRCSIVSGCRGILGRPFEQKRVVCVVAAARFEVCRNGRVRGIDYGIELAETARAALIELGMKSETLETSLGTLSLDGVV